MANILVVDDEKGIRDILEQLLSKEGYEVHIANDGKEAIEKVHNLSPDLMILDLKMPDIDGFEVCAEIRKNTSQSELPILIISGNDNPEDELKALEMGANEYINKPFSDNVLLTWVKILLKSINHNTKDN